MELFFACVCPVEWMFPFAFEVDGIHQEHIRICAQRVRAHEFWDFAMSLLSNIAIDDLSTFHWILEIQCLNARSELVDCYFLEFGIQCVSLLHVNLICQVELGAANVALQLLGELVVLIGQRDFIHIV